ncbi:MFS transporter [Saccharospirillum sp. HFRX-1]|uniref:MFS transporter n=1 Tax=unclassified Saccharospirillum TaxID=2633430 RepID=UPI0037178D4C
MALVNRLSLHYLLAGMSLGVFVAVQTLFLQIKGMDLTQIGLLFGAYASATTVLELPLGALADRYGRVRIYALSRLLTLLAALLCLVSTDFGWLFAALALAGVGRALDSGSIEAWQVEALERTQLGHRLDVYIGRFHSCTATGLAAGAILGGYLPTWLGPFWCEQPATQWNLLLQAGLTALHLCLLPWLFHEGDLGSDHGSGVQPLRQALAQLRSNQTLRALVLVAWIIGLLLFALETYWQARLRTLFPTISYAVFGWLSSGYFLAAVVGPWVLTRLVRRFGGASSFWLMALLGWVALVFAALAWQSSLIGFASAYLGFMFSLSMLNVPLETLVARTAPSHLRATLFSLISLAVQAGGLAVAFGFSWLLPWLGISGLWWSLAGLGALTAILLPRLMSSKMRPTQ